VPIFTVIAGPNGSGKSTLTASVDFEGRENLIDPDAIARRLKPLNPASAAFAAGREAMSRIGNYRQSGVSFAVETTLSGRNSVATIHEAKRVGYQVHLIYVALNNPEANVGRVRYRVSTGGHGVPDEDIRRRYRRSMENVVPAIQLADWAVVYDNSELSRRKMLEFTSSTLIFQSPKLTPWAARILQALTAVP